MKRPSGPIAAASLLALVVIAACSTPAREAVPVSPAGAPRYTEADVQFMHHMIAHHAQALEMTSLVAGRTTREDLHLLAERIEVSQQDEIAMMRSWLENRGEEVPSLDGDHDDHEAGTQHGGHEAGGDHALMPGMLTSEELARLAEATGPEFDRLFLEFMIHHHEGALVMVADLFASPGAGQESQIFQIASEVDADQRIEISRMREMQG